MIPHEPVRGRTPPPWFWSLSGIERVRAFSRGVLPWPPLSRLLGMRTTHVAAGTVTVAMPASDASIAAYGMLQIVPPMMSALLGASYTALPGGIDLVPLRFTLDPFRPAWPQPGNLIARARVVNSSNLYVFAEVQVQDPVGRHLGQGSLNSLLRRVEPTPPTPPDALQPVEEPVYQTPDPYLRSFPSSQFAELAQLEEGVAILRKVADGRLSVPAKTLYGIAFDEIAGGEAAVSIPASEWFCMVKSDVSYHVIAALADISAWSAAITLHQPGQSITLLDSATRFLQPVQADGRPLRAKTVFTEPVPHLFIADTKIRNADSGLVALHSGSYIRLEDKHRTRRQRKGSRRMLATLLFTDIVDSTGHAQRLGDAAWHALLEQHKLAVRREVSRHNGTEVDTTGDGFFIRFDSPAHAIEAARAARVTVAALGIQIRAGIHTGECELEGDKLAGMAVHIAARIQAAAEPGEVLVSSTVKDLTIGSTTRFTDKGERNLKGVPDRWRIYAVAD